MLLATRVQRCPPQCRASRRATAKYSNGGGPATDEASPGADGGGGEPSPGAVTAPAADVGKPCLAQRCGRPGVRTGELPRSCRLFTRAPLGVLSGDPKCAARARSVQAGMLQLGLTELADGRRTAVTRDEAARGLGRVRATAATHKLRRRGRGGTHWVPEVREVRLGGVQREPRVEEDVRPPTYEGSRPLIGPTAVHPSVLSTP